LARAGLLRRGDGAVPALICSCLRAQVHVDEGGTEGNLS
jgi:hypothetical protein